MPKRYKYRVEFKFSRNRNPNLKQEICTYMKIKFKIHSHCERWCSPTFCLISLNHYAYLGKVAE